MCLNTLIVVDGAHSSAKQLEFGLMQEACLTHLTQEVKSGLPGCSAHLIMQMSC